MRDEAFQTESSQEFDSAVRLVEAAVSRNTYATAEIRCVAWLSKGEWRNAVCVARAVLDSPVEAASLEYPEVCLLSAAIEPADLGAWLVSAKEGQVRVGDRRVAVAPATYFSRSRLPGFNRLSVEPGELLELGSPQAEHPQQSWRPILAPGLPYHADLASAVREWLRRDDFSRTGSEQYGKVFVFLPDTRARISSLRYADGQLVVRVEGQLAGEPLEIKGEYVHGQRATRLDARTITGSATLAIPDTIERLDLYVLGADGTVYDYHREADRSCVGHPAAVLVPPPPAAGLATIEDALEKGECETVEFKEFVRPGDKKFGEVIETVIAFANTRGGVLLIGVDDDGEVVGVERGLLRMANAEGREVQTLAPALDEYVGRVRKDIASVVTPSVAIRVSSARFADRTVVLIEVPKGPGLHHDVKTRDTRVRRGSTNRRPPPTEEPGPDDPFRRAFGLR